MVIWLNPEVLRWGIISVQEHAVNFDELLTDAYSEFWFKFASLGWF